MVTCKFHPPSKPQPYNTVSLARVTMPCTGSSDLIHPIADRLYPFINISPLLPSHIAWQPLSSCFWESDFFFDATNKWLPSNFCPWLVKHIQNLSFSFIMNNLSETVFFFFLNLFLLLFPEFWINHFTFLTYFSYTVTFHSYYAQEVLITYTE